MGWDRRSVLAAGVGLLAGCNGRSDASVDRTATPVDVPAAPTEALESAAGTPVPTVPSAVVVSAGHRDAVVGHASDRIRAARRALAGTDAVALDDVRGLWNPDAPFQAARRAVQAYRSAPSPRRFAALIPSVGDVATIRGHVRAVSGTLGIPEVRAAYRAALDRHTAVATGLDFRLAAPVGRLFPTVRTAVDALERAGTQRGVAERRVAGLAGARAGMLATTVASVALLRFETINAAGYLATTLDRAAPSRLETVTSLARTHRSALARVDVTRRPWGRRVPEPISRRLAGLRARRSRLLADDPNALDPTDRVELLFAALEVRGQLEAVAAAGAATAAAVGDEGVPPDRVPAEKRRAVDRLETLADGTALQRRLGRRATDLVADGDRVDPDAGRSALSTATFLYAAGRRFAALSLRRGDRVADALASGRVSEATD